MHFCLPTEVGFCWSPSATETESVQGDGKMKVKAQETRPDTSTRLSWMGHKLKEAPARGNTTVL
jgi:hypothetical protein